MATLTRDAGHRREHRPEWDSHDFPTRHYDLVKEFVVALVVMTLLTVALAAVITGLTEKAIRRKIEDGKWLEGREYRRSPDGGIFISIKGYQQWVEQAAA